MLEAVERHVAGRVAHALQAHDAGARRELQPPPLGGAGHVDLQVLLLVVVDEPVAAREQAVQRLLEVVAPVVQVRRERLRHARLLEHHGPPVERRSRATTHTRAPDASPSARATAASGSASRTLSTSVVTAAGSARPASVASSPPRRAGSVTIRGCATKVPTPWWPATRPSRSSSSSARRTVIRLTPASPASSFCVGRRSPGLQARACG